MLRLAPPGPFLDRALLAMRRGAVWEGMDLLLQGLAEARGADGSRSWERFVRDVALPHPVREALHEDPFTRRAFERPRGYPADPVTLDYLYGAEGLPASGSGRGAEVHAYTTSGAFARAVRQRRKAYAAALDALPRGRGARVLAVGAGHLRELELSRAFHEGEIGSVLALDGDREAAEAVARTHGAAATPVEAHHTSLHRLLDGSLRPGPVDLAFTGLWFDLLETPAARSLAGLLFSMLAHGGELLLSAFPPGLPDAAYLESYMRWPLVYRSEQDLTRLLDDVDVALVSALDVTRDPGGNLVVLRAKRR